MTEYHSTPIRVLYGDVDSMKQAYYGNYLRWFETGRAEYLRAHGVPYNEVERRGYFLPVSEVFCKYLKPIHYDDLIFIEAKPDQVRKASARFLYRLLNEEGGDLAFGYTLHPCLDAEGRIVRIPRFLLNILD
jgi:acyl-CoA thioester hydrolase